MWPIAKFLNYPPYHRVLALLTSTAAILFVSCESSTEPPKALSTWITPADTIIFASDTLTFEAVVEYESGPAAPDTVVWSVSDTTVLALVDQLAAQAVVEGRARGEAYLISLVNDALTDSALVRVIRPGDIRWQAAIGATWLMPTPALDTLGRVHVVSGSATERVLSVFEPGGSLVHSVPTCPYSDMSPSVSLNGSAHLTGWGCTQRHAPDGSIDWTFPLGSFDGGVAVASDGSVIVVYDEVPELRNVVLSRISSGGIELWRDTLGPSFGEGSVQKSAPVVDTTGDIYVAWRDADVNWLSRNRLDGTPVWSAPLSGWSKRSTPALHGEVVVVSYLDGVAVYDTTGALLWERGDPSGHTSSPIVDPDGNIFVQSHSGLFSYDLLGSLRWSADSLGCSGCVETAAAAPTLLQSGELVVPCDREVCSVDTSDGSLIWRTAADEPFNSPPAVASDGTIYVTTDQVLYALWGQRPPLTEGWPTEGGNMGRLRRRM